MLCALRRTRDRHWRAHLARHMGAVLAIMERLVCSATPPSADRAQAAGSDAPAIGSIASPAADGAEPEAPPSAAAAADAFPVWAVTADAKPTLVRAAGEELSPTSAPLTSRIETQVAGDAGCESTTPERGELDTRVAVVAKPSLAIPRAIGAPDGLQMSTTEVVPNIASGTPETSGGPSSPNLPSEALLDSGLGHEGVVPSPALEPPSDALPPASTAFASKAAESDPRSAPVGNKRTPQQVLRGRVEYADATAGGPNSEGMPGPAGEDGVGAEPVPKRVRSEEVSVAGRERAARQAERATLQELRAHLDTVASAPELGTDVQSGALREHFAQAEGNLERTLTVHHALVEARIFRTLSGYARAQAAAMNTSLSTYDVSSFVDALVHIRRLMCAADPLELPASSEIPVVAGAEAAAINLVDIGAAMGHLFATVPSISFMYSTAWPALDERRPPAPARAVKAPACGAPRTTRPAVIAMGGSTSTEQQLAQMLHVLRERRSVLFWELVTDPDPGVGYGRTVENIFHASFLVNERHASIDLRPELPVMHYLAERPARGESCEQVVVGLDIAKWREVVEQYGVTEALLSRKQTAPALPAHEDSSRRRKRM